MTTYLKITDILTPQTISLSLESTEKDALIGEMVGLLKKAEKISSAEEALEAVIERERCMTTGIGKGFAIPHGKYPGVKNIAGALGIARQGVEFESMDGQPVEIIVLLVSHPKMAHLHLSAISLLTRTFKDPDLKTALFACQNTEELYEKIREYEQGKK